MTELLNSMHPWAVFLLGSIGSSVIWLGVCWALLNQRDLARWESEHLRVCRCRDRLRRDATLRTRVRIGGEVA